MKIEIQVECYAGYRGEETPRKIRIGTGEIAVKEIIDRWLAPEHRYFKVLGEDEAIYILRHDTRFFTWELVFYSVKDLPFEKYKSLLEENRKEENHS